MTFFRLVLANLWSKKARTIGLLAAVGFAVMIVVSLAVASQGLESSAAEVMRLGKADFSIAQKGVSDILSSSIDEGEVARIRAVPGVARAVGVYVVTERIDAANPVFIEIGIAPEDLAAFGVTVVSGQAYAPDAANQVLVGWRAAENLDLHVGSSFRANGTVNQVVGVYSTGNSFGDAGAMFPLPAVQGYNRVPGVVTLMFVRVGNGHSIPAVMADVDRRMPQLTTIRTAAEFGRANTNLVYLKAAVTGSTILAVVIGTIIVANAMLLSLFERTREFGILRAVGWARPRVTALVVAEAVAVALAGAVVGVGLSFAMLGILQNLPRLQGVLHAHWSTGAFWRAFITALATTLLGSLYPSLRVAFLPPMRALREE